MCVSVSRFWLLCGRASRLWATVILAAALCQATASPGSANQSPPVDCHLPDPVQNLRDEVRETLASEQQAPRSRIERLTLARLALIAHMNAPVEDPVPGLSALAEAAQALVTRNNRRAGTAYTRFEEGLTRYCTRASKRADGQGWALPDFLAGKLEIPVPFGGGDTAPNQKTTLNAGILLAVALGLVARFVAASRLHGIWRAYRLNRKTCLISLRLSVDGFAFFGHVTVLGLRGFRFVPEDDAAIEGIHRLARFGGSALLVEDIVIPCRLYRADETGVVAFFELPLSLAEHQELLSRSSRAPVFVPAKRLPKRNIPEFDTGQPPRRARTNPQGAEANPNA